MPPPPPETAPSRGWGVGGCLIGCLGLLLVSAIFCGGGVWYFWIKLPDIARAGVVKAVQESELTPRDKELVIAQINRIAEQYKAGNITPEQLGRIMEELAESPLMALMIVYAAMEKYVEPSGLSPQEKSEAKLTMQRLARGVFEERIDPDLLDPALDHLSTEKPDGNREFKDRVSDEELRAFLSESKQLADDADIPVEPFEVDIGAQFKHVVDKALQAPPEELLPEAPLETAP
jgi:hypothetical protein